MDFDPRSGPRSDRRSDDDGRAGELVEIRRLVGDLGAGQGRILLITGPPGIGKTFLAHRLLRELPPSVPVSPAGPTIAAVGADLSDDVRAERAVDLLLAQAAAAPAVVVLDDLDRADGPTLAVVDALGARLRIGALLFVVCARSGADIPPAVTEVLDRLGRRPTVTGLPLAGLAEDVVGRIIVDAADGIGPRARRLILDAAAGNPLLARELARRRTPGHRLPGTGEGPLPPFGTTPQGATFRDVVFERVVALRADDVLAALTVTDGPITVQVLAEACGLSPAVTRHVVDRAVALGLVAAPDGAGQIRLTHEAFREVLLERLAPDEIRRIHLRLAAVWDPATQFPGPRHVERARHLIAAGERDESAAQACLVAGNYAESSGDVAAALELASYGTYSCENEPATRVRLLCLSGRCLARTGELAAARRALTRAVETARRLRDAALVARAVLDLTAVDDALDSVEGVEAADGARRISLLETAAAGVADDDPMRALLLARLSQRLRRSDPPRSRAVAQRAVDAAVGDEPEAVRAAYQAWGLAMSGLTHLADLEQARSRLDALGHRADSRLFSVYLTPAIGRGDRPAVDDCLSRVTDDARRRRGSRPEPLLHLAALALAVADGDAARVAALAAETPPTPDDESRTALAALHLLWQFHAAGSTSGPIEVGAAGAARLAPVRDAAELISLLAAGLQAARGDDALAADLRHRMPTGAWRAVTAGLEPDGTVGGTTVGASAMTDLTWAVAALFGSVTGDREACRGAVSHFAAHHDAFVVLSTAVVGPVGWFTSAAYRGLGETTHAVEANRRALDLSRRFAAPAWIARCLVQAAELAVEEDPGRARELAEDAAALSRDRQLTGIAEHAVRILAPLPASPCPLNPAQLELLRLAAKGLSNDQIARRLYVSTPTVERHLSQIYRILGVANRAAATRWLSRNGPEFVVSTEF
jgi:DNA-binding CsgD family transcriptional regulator/DNA polymerase III delta prime subunit